MTADRFRELADADRLLDALDLPPQLEDVQRAYWAARGDWERLAEAYRLVVVDMLARLPGGEGE